MKYGPKRILERCTNFLNRGFVLGTTTLIAQLSQVPAAYEPIFVTGRFHVRLMEKYWVYTKNPSEDPEAHSVQSVTLAMLLLIGMCCAGRCYGVYLVAYVSFLQVNVKFLNTRKPTEYDNQGSCHRARLDVFGRAKFRPLPCHVVRLRFVSFPFNHIVPLF